MSRSFEAQVDAWVRKAKGRAEAIFKQSAQEVFSIAQTPVAQGGNMPVDTGFLRNSLTTGINGVGSTQGADAYVLTIAMANLGDTIDGGWTAEYARHVEYGARGQPGRFFVGMAAQQWQAIVNRNAERLKGMG